MDKKLLGRIIVCKKCGQCAGTLLRVGDHYEHKQCGNNPEQTRQERRHPKKETKSK